MPRLETRRYLFKINGIYSFWHNYSRDTDAFTGGNATSIWMPCKFYAARYTTRERERERGASCRNVAGRDRRYGKRKRRKSSRHIFAQRKIVEGTMYVKHAYVGLNKFQETPTRPCFDRFSLPYARRRTRITLRFCT